MQNDAWISKYMIAGMSPVQIANKLGLTPEEVESRWKAIVAASLERMKSGAQQLGLQFQVLCQQYSLMGESLKLLASAISNEATREEIVQLIGEEATSKLLDNYIVLRPFVMKDPIEELEKHLQRTQEAN